MGRILSSLTPSWRSQPTTAIASALRTGQGGDVVVDVDPDDQRQVVSSFTPGGIAS